MKFTLVLKKRKGFREEYFVKYGDKYITGLIVRTFQGSKTERKEIWKTQFGLEVRLGKQFEWLLNQNQRAA